MSDRLLVLAAQGVEIRFKRMIAGSTRSARRILLIRIISLLVRGCPSWLPEPPLPEDHAAKILRQKVGHMRSNILPEHLGEKLNLPFVLLSKLEKSIKAYDRNESTIYRQKNGASVRVPSCTSANIWVPCGYQ